MENEAENEAGSVRESGAENAVESGSDEETIKPVVTC